MPTKLLLVAATLAALTNPAAPAQSTAAATPKLDRFDVISIRPCPDPREHRVPGPAGMYPPLGNSSPGRLRTGCFPLLDDHGMGLIRAYADDPFTPINGGPSWIHSAFYQIDAVAEGNPSVKTMMGPMMQSLLEDRFHLKIHRQMGEGPVYILTIARGGPKLHPFAAGSCTPYTSPPPPLQSGQRYCDSLISSLSPASVEDQGATLDDFSRHLLAVLDRPVINRTGIPGRFDIHIEFSREGTRLTGLSLMPPIEGSSSASDPTNSPSIFTALEEQLGLKLSPAKGPIEALVIDRIEKPSEN